ncbi:hypothetical protein OAM69_06545 [bacterium]|nr:hypothetical protein [bacterium]
MSKDTLVAVPTNRPRCYLMYALAPEGVTAREANDAINQLVGDPELSLALWHDHFWEARL